MSPILRRFPTLLLALGVALFGAGAAAEPERYAFDREHLTVAFTVSHIGFADTLVVFTDVDGSFTFDPDANVLTDLVVTIAADSANSHHGHRDSHIHGKDFLDAGNHPEITFVGTGTEATSATTGQIFGDLTIRGVTRPATLDVTLNKIGPYPYGSNHVVGISARASINRSEFGMTYGIGLVGDQVDAIIEVEAIRQ